MPSSNRRINFVLTELSPSHCPLCCCTSRFHFLCSKSKNNLPFVAAAAALFFFAAAVAAVFSFKCEKIESFSTRHNAKRKCKCNMRPKKGKANDNDAADRAADDAAAAVAAAVGAGQTMPTG